MLSLAERVDRTILRYSLLPPGARVIVALSGGADSTALACLLVELADPPRGFVVAAAAHLQPSSAADCAGEDEEFCRSSPRTLGIPWSAGEAATCGRSRSGRGASLEDAGAAAPLRVPAPGGPRVRRDARRRRPHPRRPGRDRAAPDDSRRGSAAASWHAPPARWLGGHRPTSSGAGHFDTARPAAARSGSRGAGRLAQAARTGYSGGRVEPRPPVSRNRVRHEVLPFLREHVSPSIVTVLARNAEIAASRRRISRGPRPAGVRSPRPRIRDGTVASRTAARPACGSRMPIRRRVDAAGPAGTSRGGRFVGRDQVARVARTGRRAGRGRPGSGCHGGGPRRSGGPIVLSRSGGRGHAHLVGNELLGCALSIQERPGLPGSSFRLLFRPWNGSRLMRAPDAPGDGDRRGGGRCVACCRGSDGAHSAAGGLVSPARHSGGGRRSSRTTSSTGRCRGTARDRVPLVVDDGATGSCGWRATESTRSSASASGTRDVVILKLRGESA